jgi:thiamine monophosphate synthase
VQGVEAAITSGVDALALRRRKNRADRYHARSW